MTENQNTPSNSGEGNPSSPEQITDQNQQAIEALAMSHDELVQKLAEGERKIAEMTQQMAEIQRQLESRGDGSTSAQTETTDSSSQTSNEQPVPSSPEKEKEESKPDIQRDLERIAQATGRSVDDPDVKKLLVREKAAQFAKFSQAYEDQSGTVRQEGFMQDVATAKREFEEALYLYDPKFAEMDAQYDRTKAVLDRTTDPDERARLRQELYRLKDHGSVGDGNEDRPGGSPRRDAADALLARVGDVARSLEGTEILATYELNKGEYPEDPISSRRRTDTKDWRGKPEFENGIYVGSSPERTGEWVIEPKAPIGALEKEVKDAPPVGESQGVGEVSPAEVAETQGTSPEARQRVEVPTVDPGEYPELYARMKNLVGGDPEKLKEEADRVAAEITANVEARVNNFLVENPDATPEQTRQFAMSCYVDAQNGLQEDIIAAIDGKGYTNAAGEVIGRSALRRFGAWMDRNGSKLKKRMLIVGAVGVVALTAGVAAGAIVPAFAIGAGTAIGATKGAMVGLGMSRHGSEKSYSKDVGATNETYEEMFKNMDPADADRFARMSDHLMQQFNQAADKDHVQNVKKSRNAAVVGAVLGGIFGSISFQSTHEMPAKTIEVKNDVNLPKNLDKIGNGELSGQVIDRVLNQMGVEHKPFTMPDGSTNSALIKSTLGSMYDKLWGGSAGSGGTHSYAGADPLSNGGIKAVVMAVAKLQAGTHMETVTQAVSNTFTNIPATIGGWLSGLLLTGAATRQAAESVKKEEPNFQYSPESSESSPTAEPAPEANPPQQGAQPVTT